MCTHSHFFLSSRNFPPFFNAANRQAPLVPFSPSLTKGLGWSNSLISQSLFLSFFL